MSWLLFVVACGPTPSQTVPDPPDPPDATDPAPTTDTSGPILPPGGTDTPTETGTPPPPTGYTAVDCAALPEPTYQDVLDLQPEEDFDFDGDGYMVYQSGSNIAGLSFYGDFKTIATNVAFDPSGVQVTASNQILVGAQDTGTIKLVDADAGTSQVLIGGLTQPNGIEVESTGRVYFTEFTTNGRIRWIDPVTLVQGTIDDDTYMPNGVVLSLDEQTLYVGGNVGVSDAAILAYHRTGPDTWDPVPTLLFDGGPGSDFDAVEVDECGNIYTIEYTLGRLLRISPDGSEVVELVTIDAAGFNEFNSIRWGNGIGGWRRDTLYVTNRQNVWQIQTYVLGKRHPATPADWTLPVD